MSNNPMCSVGSVLLLMLQVGDTSMTLWLEIISANIAKLLKNIQACKIVVKTTKKHERNRIVETLETTNHLNIGQL